MFKDNTYNGELYIEDITTKNRIRRTYKTFNEELNGYKSLTREEIVKELIRQRITQNKGCVDCFDIENCKNCIESSGLINCTNCETSVALYNCHNCKLCMGLDNQSNLENECSFGM